MDLLQDAKELKSPQAARLSVARHGAHVVDAQALRRALGKSVVLRASKRDPHASPPPVPPPEPENSTLKACHKNPMPRLVHHPAGINGRLQCRFLSGVAQCQVRVLRVENV